MRITTREQLSPEQQKAVSYATARLFLAVGLVAGALYGSPEAFWFAGIVLVYAIVALVWSAWREASQ